jgi:hypothetical protein
MDLKNEIIRNQADDPLIIEEVKRILCCLYELSGIFIALV